MDLWVIFALAGGLLVLTLVPGVYLWWPSRDDPVKRTDLGLALLAGATIAFSIFALQLVFDTRIHQLEERRDDARFEAERNAASLSFIADYDDLSKIDLSGRDLPGLYLRGKKFVEARLDDANLTGAVLANTDFTGATLRRADLSWIRADEANFGSARLEGANLRQALINQANFGFARLEGANLRQGVFVESSLQGALLAEADLTQADLSIANLRNADLRQANLSGASLAGADLRGADLSGATVDDETTLAGSIYDANTVFPASLKQRRCPPRRTCEAS